MIVDQLVYAFVNRSGLTPVHFFRQGGVKIISGLEHVTGGARCVYGKNKVDVYGGLTNHI